MAQPNERIAKDNRFIYLIVFVVALIGYLLTLSHNLVASHDSIGYYNQIERGEWLFHPHHLLYNPISILWLQFWRRIGLSGGGSIIVESLNAVFGAAGLAVLFFILRRRLKASVSAAISTILVIGSSFGFWFYSACVEVYLIPLFFLLAALAVLLKPKISLLDAFIIGVLHGIAILFHQIHVLFGFAIVARLFLRPEDLGSARIKSILIYLLPALGIIAIGYGSVLAFVVKPHDLNDILYWGTSYAHTLSDAWNVPGFRSLQKAFIGFSHSIFGGQFLFAIKWFQVHLGDFIGGAHELKDEMFLVSTLSSGLAWVLLIMSLTVGLIVLLLLIRSVKYLKQYLLKPSPAVLAIGIWMVVYCLYFWVWDPTNLEFWIPQSVLLWLIIYHCLNMLEERQEGLATGLRLLLPIFVFTVNYFGSIHFLTDEHNDYFYVQSEMLASRTTKNDLVLTDEQWILESYFSRFLKAKVYSIQDLSDSKNEKYLPQEAFSNRMQHVLNDGGTIVVSTHPDEEYLAGNDAEKLRSFLYTALDTSGLKMTYRELLDDRFLMIKR